MPVLCVFIHNVKALNWNLKCMEAYGVHGFVSYPGYVVYSIYD